MNINYKHELFAMSFDTQIMDSFIKTAEDSKFYQFANKLTGNSYGKSNSSSKSKYTTNSKLIKSNFYSIVRRGNLGSQYHKE